jgi:hypothetical protein
LLDQKANSASIIVYQASTTDIAAIARKIKNFNKLNVTTELENCNVKTETACKCGVLVAFQQNKL